MRCWRDVRPGARSHSGIQNQATRSATGAGAGYRANFGSAGRVQDAAPVLARGVRRTDGPVGPRASVKATCRGCQVPPARRCHGRSPRRAPRGRRDRPRRPERSSHADDSTTGVTGEHTTQGRPHGVTSLTPFLAIPRAGGGGRLLPGRAGRAGRGRDRDRRRRRARRARLRPRAPPARRAHARLRAGAAAGRGRLLLDRALLLRRRRPDRAAEAAGAQVREAPSTFVSGDRFASIVDPFGVRWSLMTPRRGPLGGGERPARARVGRDPGLSRWSDPGSAAQPTARRPPVDQASHVE